MGVFSKGLVDFKTIIKTAKKIVSHAEKKENKAHWNRWQKGPCQLLFI